MPAPIADTPVLKGNSAKEVLKEMEKAPTEKSKLGAKILINKYQTKNQ